MMRRRFIALVGSAAAMLMLSTIAWTQETGRNIGSAF
jgi:hypothetical protein